MHEPTAPRARLSVLRLLGLLAVVAVAVVAVVKPFESATAESSSTPAGWFAPYVDVTLTPAFPFGDTRYNPADTAVLGFVVSDPASPCTPSWGGFYGIDDAATAVDLDRRLATLERRGGSPIVSFGGAVNTDLAVGCTDTGALADAYEAVLDRYGATIADFDVELGALTDADARTRRAEAVAAVQDRSGGELEVWLTLPVSTAGLTADGVATVQAFLDAGVEVAGVNAMTMDFGSLSEGDPMSDAAASALEATAVQVDDAFSAAGRHLSEAELWAHLGATVMIGRNDVRTEVFTLDDVARLLSFAHEHGLGRLSMWSLNRDAACGPEVDGGVAQNTCSGVDQDPGAFATAFATGVVGTPTGEPAVAADPKASREASLADDPATAPYPIWAPGPGYTGGDKVVWHGNVYQAKWWNQNVQPDTPAANPWDTPWSLVGPVLPTDRPAPTTTIPEGWYPEWNPATNYQAGSEVQHGGVAYQAKWFSRGFEPGTATVNPWDTPWAVIPDPAQGGAPTSAAQDSQDGIAVTTTTIEGASS